MYAVEFQTRIKNGIIEIPEAYRSQFKERVRVILLTEEANLASDLIDELLQQPLKAPGFTPLTREELYERS